MRRSHFELITPRIYEFGAGLPLCTARPKSPMRIRTHQRDAMRAHRRRHGLPTPRG